jgi:hypothetical protein
MQKILDWSQSEKQYKRIKFFIYMVDSSKFWFY